MVEKILDEEKFEGNRRICLDAPLRKQAGSQIWKLI
jgi:hypothetical protein